ncbi:SGNH/GDSL hydrolase family protein [Jidongwangia harbinensis]|uniref:SGNH/GDSL hydrolase family protein n=1 Tax=Jidongwangia harbinensis TaxID=2878561 RepID=UPI001CD96F96|nr:SGNH/GDSL hydrolase family protein [Jidongwangia harbinensis]MCA2213943.1 SGNH/GDSL hydrolase family protein [Jidongwangia harbinensis]
MGAGAVIGGVAGAAAAVAVLTGVVLAVQIVVTPRRIRVPEEPPPRGDVTYGPRSAQRALTMVVLGDSFAAGYGASRSRECPAALLAAGVSRRMRCRVSAYTLAVLGAETPDLCHQVDRAVRLRPDVAVVYIGGNDVTQLSAQGALVRQLGDGVRRLRAAGCEVVVGTCPDLGVLPPFRAPLRWLARFLSRRLAAAQTVEVRRAGGVTVSLAELLNPAFEADPDRMFGADRFHPSADGYAKAAAVTLPTLLAVLGARSGRRPVPVPRTTVPVGLPSLGAAAR